jgi:uncharacterized protein (DUF1800 family)
VDRLLGPEAGVAAFERTYKSFEDSVRDGESAEGLRKWWLRRMIETPDPLREKMTLFWHGHFAVSNREVSSAAMMVDHVRLLRRGALGSYRDLLAAVAGDPAMLKCAGSAENRRARPAAGFPRVLLQHLTVGPGACSEGDVSESARAFTGWFVRRNQAQYIEREHDEGEKTVLGERGHWGGSDVVRIALDRRASAEMLVRELWRYLISEEAEPGPDLLEPLVDGFYPDYDVAALLERILRSNLFYSPLAYRARVKSPVEYAVGIVRAHEALVATEPLAIDLAGLGQDVCHPPTGDGWPGGRYWVNGFTMAGRANLAADLLAGSGRYGRKLDPEALSARHGRANMTAAAEFLGDVFLQGDLPPGITDLLRRAAGRGRLSEQARRLAGCLVTLPEYHLA